MTDKKLFKELQRRALQLNAHAKLTRARGPSGFSAGTGMNSNREKTLKRFNGKTNGFHATSFIKGGMFALEVLRAEAKLRKLTE